MKKILIALAMVGFASFSAEAQTVACGKPEGKVCRKGSCYKTKYAENYKVCKGSYGYFICCEEPNGTNSTFPPLPVAGVQQYTDADNDQTYAVHARETEDEYRNEQIPQSQSYPVYSANAVVSYAGYYPAGKGKIRACTNTNNVAEANRQAYNGCPTPAYDGPEKNQRRNVNVSNPSSSYPQAPIGGNKLYQNM